MSANIPFLARTFKALGYQWKVDGQYITPDEDDLRKCLDRMADVLDDGDIGMSIEVGRLRMEKTEDGLETYIWTGLHERL